MTNTMNSQPKFIFITGGVVSSLGKGLASASLASLLQSRGFKVRLRKLDPYLNVDPQEIRTHPPQGRSSDFLCLVDDIGLDCRFCPVGQNHMDAASF